MKKEIMAILTETPQILKLLYTDLAQPPIRKISIALETIFDLSNTILLPVKLINEKSKIIFKNNLDKYSEKINNIDNVDICKVPPEIGIPIIEKFTYITNEKIQELFATLLAKASSTKTINQAHPAFIHIINRLSADEAVILDYFCDNPSICHISFKLTTKDSENEFIDIETRLTHFNVKLIFPENKNKYFDNLISLGLIKNHYDRYRASKIFYNYDYIIDYYNERRIEINNEYADLYNPVEIIKGFYEVTEFGKFFIETCLNKKVEFKFKFVTKQNNKVEK
jgi:hypothetical protein